MNKNVIFVIAGGLLGLLLSSYISGDYNYLPMILGGGFGIGFVLLMLKLFNKPTR